MLKSELRQRSSVARDKIKQDSLFLFRCELKQSMIETADSGKDNGKYLIRDHRYVELIDLLGRTAERTNYIDWLLRHIKRDNNFRGIKFNINRLEVVDYVEFSWDEDDSDE